jgi:hypothetical protein
MLGRRSLNLELANFDSEIERTARGNRRIPPNSPTNSQSSESESDKSVEMGERNPPRSLRQLFAPDATSAPSCIVVPENATRFELKPSSLMYKFNCTRQLHESIVVMWLCKCEVEPTENRVCRKLTCKRLN